MGSSTSPSAAPATAAGACPSIARDLADEFRKFHGAQTLNISDALLGSEAAVLLLPEGVRAHSLKPYLDEFRDAPERRKGTARVQRLDSFVAHVNRFKDADSVIFAQRDRVKPSLTAVLDYNRSGGDGAPRFGAHRTVYDCPVSEPWKAWTAADGKAMSQGEFAAWLEDRIGDVILPDLGSDDESLQSLAELTGGAFTGPSGLMVLARGLQVNVETTVKEALTLASGEISIVYGETHKDGAGAPIKVPNLFLIAIPVFDAGALYRIPVRLRYRVQQGRITWSVQLVRADVVFDDAFTEVCDRAARSTELPLFVGTPEA